MRVLTVRACLTLLAAIALGCVPSAAALDGPASAPPCGVATDPVCWTIQFACHNALDNATRMDCDCSCWRIGPVAAAPPQGIARAPHCENHGVVVMATLVGENRYCEGGSCANTGLVVMVGYSRSCFGEGYGTVCWADLCVVGPKDHAPIGMPPEPPGSG